MGLYKKGRSMLRKAGAALKKRYKAKPGGRKSTGGVRVAKMAKDIMYLKSVLNPEKKRDSYVILNKPVGQVNGNTDGAYFADITPVISQGVTAGTRNGASVKLHSAMYHFQFTQGVGTIANIRGVIEIWEIKGEPYGASLFTYFDEHWEANPFTGVRDINAQTNPDNFMKGRCIARKYFRVIADQTSGVKTLTDVKMPISYNKGQGKHLRYNRDTNTIEHGQMYMVIRTDRGNISGSSVSTLNVPDVNINTGLLMQYNCTNYFYDN